MNAFGEKLRKLRQEASLTQRELGKKVGVSHQVISNLERGYTTGISYDLLSSIADALGVSVKEFSNETQKKTAHSDRRSLSPSQQRLLIESWGLGDTDIEKVIEYAALLKLKRTE